MAFAASSDASLVLRATEDLSSFVAIGGPAIREPIYQAGPFVMNSKEEAQQAFMDFQSGKFGSVQAFT